jgi:hypothetical protein
MAKTPQAEFKPDGVTTDIAKNVQQHGFSGETVYVKLFKGEAHEPAQPFFGLNNYQIQIEREKWVRIPVEMANHIESIVYTVREPDPNEPENIDKMTWVEKARFPMQRSETEPVALKRAPALA